MLSYDCPFEFQTRQSELTKFFGPTAVITMVNGAQLLEHATPSTGVSVNVPDLTTVKLVVLEELITPLEGVTAAAELSMVICEGVGAQDVGVIVELAQVTTMVGKPTVKVEPMLPINDSNGLKLVESQVAKSLLSKAPRVGNAEALGAVTRPPMASPDKSNTALNPARNRVTRIGQRLQ